MKHITHLPLIQRQRFSLASKIVLNELTRNNINSQASLLDTKISLIINPQFGESLFLVDILTLIFPQNKYLKKDILEALGRKKDIAKLQLECVNEFCTIAFAAEAYTLQTFSLQQKVNKIILHRQKILTRDVDFFRQTGQWNPDSHLEFPNTSLRLALDVKHGNNSFISKSHLYENAIIPGSILNRPLQEDIYLNYFSLYCKNILLELSEWDLSLYVKLQTISQLIDNPNIPFRAKIIFIQDKVLEFQEESYSKNINIFTPSFLSFRSNINIDNFEPGLDIVDETTLSSAKLKINYFNYLAKKHEHKDILKNLTKYKWGPTIFDNLDA